MDALIGLALSVGLAYALLRLLSWAFYSWERGWWFQNPRTMKIRSQHATSIRSTEYEEFLRWRVSNPRSPISFSEWQDKLRTAMFWDGVEEFRRKQQEDEELSAQEDEDLAKSRDANDYFARQEIYSSCFDNDR